MKPDFTSMNRSQLRDYTLSHREGREALYALIDRCHAENPAPRMSLNRLEAEILTIVLEKGEAKSLGSFNDLVKS
jgi:hypothetical protein